MQTKISMWIGFVVLILSGIILMVTNTNNYILGIIILLGLILFGASFFSYIGMGKPKDERLRKIGTLATTQSWFLTLQVICIILILYLWYGISSISIASLGGILFVMIATMFVVNIYQKRKGDFN